MSIINNNNHNNIESPKLRAVIVEHILLSCIHESSICELSFEIQRIFPFPYTTLKKYLFYLTNYELIKYDGQKQAYIIKERGFDILDRIDREKKIAMVNCEGIVIIIE
jgi:hypothetical protein